MTKGTGVEKLFSESGWGFVDLFGLGHMSGGFDEAAWGAKGLPASGSIKLRLTLEDVGVR